MNGFLFLTCACGLKIKVPPDFKQSSLPCPRCQRELQVPTAEFATVAAGLEAASGKLSIDSVAAASTQATYSRKGVGWESFQCACGKNLQLSPAFKGSKIVCNGCGKATIIGSSETK
jgi:heat shock protein HtpX